MPQNKSKHQTTTIDRDVYHLPRRQVASKALPAPRGQEAPPGGAVFLWVVVRKIMTQRFEFCQKIEIILIPIN